MPFQELPSNVQTLLSKYSASPALVAHLTVVHDVASSLIGQLDACWPELAYDKAGVLFGAATHDIGKTLYPEELTGPGSQHEVVGPQLLLENGFPEAYARFARTHARWEDEISLQLEDLLVAFVDTIWKGKRDETLEQELARYIARQCQTELWQVYMQLDDIACTLARDAHARILWQGRFSL